MIEKIDLTNKSRDEWLELRKRDVTASGMGALAGADPYCSRLRYYHRKIGTIPEDGQSPVLRRGRLFESAVAEAVREQRPEWVIAKAQDYWRDTEARIGATPDYYVSHKDRRGVLQCKTCTPAVFDREWQDGMVMPFNTTLQLVTEIMLTGASFGAAAALRIDPYDVRCAIIEIEKHEPSEKRIRELVKQFWDDVAAGREPQADYALDRDLIAALRPHEQTGKAIDLHGDNEIAAGLAERADLKERIKHADARCKAIEALLMERMGDAERVTGIQDFKVTWRTEQHKEYVVKARASRVLRIYDRREEAA